MNQQIEKLLDELEGSSESAAASVADHIRTVASNGLMYATPMAIKDEAEALAGWAKRLADGIVLAEYYRSPDYPKALEVIYSHPVMDLDLEHPDALAQASVIALLRYKGLNHIADILEQFSLEDFEGFLVNEVGD